MQTPPTDNVECDFRNATAMMTVLTKREDGVRVVRIPQPLDKRMIAGPTSFIHSPSPTCPNQAKLETCEPLQ